MTQPVKKFSSTIADVISGVAKSPLNIDVIPNYMGINLCSVDRIEWHEKEDGQLVELTIVFIPGNGQS